MAVTFSRINISDKLAVTMVVGWQRRNIQSVTPSVLSWCHVLTFVVIFCAMCITSPLFRSTGLVSDLAAISILSSVILICPLLLTFLICTYFPRSATLALPLHSDSPLSDSCTRESFLHRSYSSFHCITQYFTAHQSAHYWAAYASTLFAMTRSFCTCISSTL
jgi:hypothetical protein